MKQQPFYVSCSVKFLCNHVVDSVQSICCKNVYTWHEHFWVCEPWSEVTTFFDISVTGNWYFQECEFPPLQITMIAHRCTIYWSLKRSFPLSFSTKTVLISHFTMCAKCPTHLIPLIQSPPQYEGPYRIICNTPQLLRKHLLASHPTLKLYDFSLSSVGNTHLNLKSSWRD